MRFFFVTRVAWNILPSYNAIHRGRYPGRSESSRETANQKPPAMNEDEILQGLSDDDRAFLLSAKRMYEHADATRAPQFRNTGTSFEEAGSAVVGAIPNLLKNMVVDTAESVRRVGSDIASGLSAAVGRGEATREASLGDVINAGSALIPFSTAGKAAVLPNRAYANVRRITGEGFEVFDLAMPGLSKLGSNVPEGIIGLAESTRSNMANQIRRAASVIDERAGAAGFPMNAQSQIRGINRSGIAITDLERRDTKIMQHIDELLRTSDPVEHAIIDKTIKDIGHTGSHVIPEGSMGAVVQAGYEGTEGAFADVVTHELSHAGQFGDLYNNPDIFGFPATLQGRQRRVIDTAYDKMLNETGIGEGIFRHTDWPTDSYEHYVLSPVETHARINELRYALSPDDPYRQFDVDELWDLMDVVKGMGARNTGDLTKLRLNPDAPRGAFAGGHLLAAMSKSPYENVVPVAAKDELYEKITQLMNLLPSTAAGTAATATLWNSQRE